MRKKICTCFLLLALSVSSVIPVSAGEQKTYVHGQICNPSVNVYSKPSKSSDVVSELSYSSKITCLVENDNWYDTGNGYVRVGDVEPGGLQVRQFKLPKNSGYKSFMYSSSITSWDPLKVKNLAKVGEYGILTVDDRFCVAVGTGANIKVGQYFDAVLSNGTVIPCVLCDTKDNKDTLANNITAKGNGCVLEFVVDKSKVNKKVLHAGDVSAANMKWKSTVDKLLIYNYNILKENVYE